MRCRGPSGGCWRWPAPERAAYGAIVGRSSAMQKVFDLLDTIARSELRELLANPQAWREVTRVPEMAMAG